MMTNHYTEVPLKERKRKDIKLIYDLVRKVFGLYSQRK